MSKKKVPKGTLYGPAGGSFSQKKKVVLGNIKHSGNEKNISLVKLSSNSMYSDMDSEFSCNEDNIVIKSVNKKEVELLPPPLGISLEKKWIDPKIVKMPVEVSVRRSFALDINLSMVEGKSATTKTQFIKKIFSTAVVIKEIPINTLKDMIITALAEFGEIKLIKIQLIELWQKAVVEFAELDQAKQLAVKWSFLIGKNSVHVAIAVSDHETWASRNRFRALLFTLPVRTIVHNLDTFLDGAGGKTCVINCSMNSDNQVHCTVVGFESKEDLESAYHTVLIFDGVKLSWARLDLVCCKKCGHFGHSALECDVSILLIFKLLRLVKRVSSENHHLWLAKLYARKGVSISKSAVFGGKSWVQVVLLVSPSSGPHFDSGFGSGPLSSGSSSIKGSAPVVQNKFSINNCLTSLKCSLELLANQVLDIVHKLNGVELVPLVPITQVVLPAAPVFTLALPETDMVLNVLWLFFPLSSSVLEDKVVDLGLSSSKVFTSKVNSLESKMLALEVSIGSILGKLDLLCINLGSLVHPLHQ
ncbi:hypothetical protein G9A89_009097 [Geosiphon pyriformis]|nr:hypothetical protein G9A89_009097 [Geosiphon pyriformis]